MSTAHVETDPGERFMGQDPYSHEYGLHWLELSPDMESYGSLEPSFMDEPERRDWHYR